MFGAVVVTLIGTGLFIASRPGRDSRHLANAPIEVPRAELRLQNGLLLRLGETHPFSGLMIERSANGLLQSRSAVSEGLLHGQSEGWFTNGQVQVSEYFRHGVSHGPRTKWYPNGTKLSEGHIVDGKFEGLFRKWHENGVLAEQVEFSQGQPTGVALAYFPSGFLKARVKLKDGKATEQSFWKDGESRERLELATSGPAERSRDKSSDTTAELTTR